MLKRQFLKHSFHKVKIDSNLLHNQHQYLLQIMNKSYISIHHYQLQQINYSWQQQQQSLHQKLRQSNKLSRQQSIQHQFFRPLHHNNQFPRFNIQLHQSHMGKVYIQNQISKHNHRQGNEYQYNFLQLIQNRNLFNPQR